MKKTYNVDVDCANCAAKMEDAVKKTPRCAERCPELYDLKVESGV